jgi:AraC-like DNA-binding protein
VELAFDKINDLLEFVSQRLVNVDFQRIGDTPFHAHFRSIVATPDVRAVRTSHSPGMTFRDTRLIKDGDESLALIYPIHSTITVSQLDRERHIAPGRSVLLRHDAIGQIGAHRSCDFVALVLPPSTLCSAHLKTRDLFVERWPEDVPALKLLKAYVAVLCSRLGLMKDGLGAPAGRHIAELLCLAADEMAERPADGELEGIADARLQVALAFVKQGFYRPGITLASAASAQGISSRYLHKLFQRAGIRFTDHVNELRLEAAYEALVGGSDKPISMIALDCGFSDISHFNRLFKKRFDVTPSALRSMR